MDTPPRLPRAAVRLGFFSLAPLAVSALVGLSRDPETAMVGTISFSLYAAVLLSFLGGVRCGVEIMRDPERPNPLRLAFSAMPALGGWTLALFVTFLPSAHAAAAAFAGLFAAQYVWDHRSANAGAPSWYPVLRQVLTGGVMIICLLVPLADVLRRLSQ